MSETDINKIVGSGSAWHNTVGVYGHPPKMKQGSGNLMASHGGTRRKRKSCKYSGKKKNTRKVSRGKKGKNGKKKVKRGGSGCGCNSGGNTETSIQGAPVLGGSAQPAPSVSSLMTGSI